MKKIVIAIDGPAASGKSTTARLVAERLGYLHVDTGAMYRALALKVLERGISLTDVDAINKLIAETEITLKPLNNEIRTYLDGADVTERIRSLEVDKAASVVSTIRTVREAMVEKQRRLGQDGGIVLEGRDIGTVVFPNAELKIFLTANLEERAARRQRELKERGKEVELSVLRNEIAERDRKDATRDASPLVKSPDAIEVDTSELSIEEQVEIVVREAKRIIQEKDESNR